jgi:predicted permease
MSRLRLWFARLFGIFGGKRSDERLHSELEAHFEMLVDENLRRGMSPAEARQAARKSLGNTVRIGEEFREQRGVPWLESFCQDLRHGLRMMRKHPGFSVVAVATLALGIGANTAIFSVVNAVLLNPLPYLQPDRLVIVQEIIPLLGERQIPVAAPDVLTFQQQNHVFTAAAGFQDEFLDLTAAGQPERIRAARVSWTLFPALGVQPLLGRTFAPEEDDPGRDVAVLGYALWKQKFGGDRSIIGRTIALNRKAYTVVGVMPQSFVFPLEDLEGFGSADLWVPMSFTPEERTHLGDNFDYGLVARLKSGVSLDQAEADASLVAARIQQQYPPDIRNEFTLHAAVTPLRDSVIGKARPLMAILLGAVGLVLLIACVNVANLLLARTMGRQKEMAVRLALGAGRARLLRQFIAENMALALVGGGSGIAVAFWGNRAIVRLAPSAIPRVQDASIDVPVLLFTLLLSVAAGLVVGAAPAFAASGTDVNSSLKEGSRGSATGRRHQRLRTILVTSEIALALMLLAGAGLLIRSFIRARDVNPGFQPEHVLSFNVPLPQAGYPKPGGIRSFYRQLRDHLARLPGVQQVGFSSDLPMLATWNHTFVPENYHPAPGAQLNLCWNSVVSGDYFEALHVPLIRGRYFNDQDTPESAPVVIVSESLARRFWPHENPLGKRLKWGVAQSKSPWLTIVGVVGEVKQGALDQATLPHTYEPYSQQPSDIVSILTDMNFALRASGDPASLASAVRAEVWGLDPQLPVAWLLPMNDILEKSLTPRRFNLFLFVTFAGLALVLAAIGIYGVVSYSVTQRTHEMGIRMALGAGRGDVLGLVVRQGLVLALAGVGIGVAGGLALTRFLSTLLFHVAPTDPITFFVVSLVLATVAIAASIVPAWRATRVDPTVALRYE